MHAVRLATSDGAAARREIGLGLALAAAAVAVMWLLYPQFMSDDAFITLAFARRFVETGSPALNLGEPVNAVSSPLWFAVDAVAWWLTRAGAPDLPLLTARLASAACTVACGGLFIAVARRHVRSRRLRWLAFALLFADPWLGRWTVSGMEASCSVAVVLAALWMRADHRPTVRLASPLLLLSVGFLVRHELVLLGGLLALEQASGMRDPTARPPAARAVLLVTAAVALVAGWLLFAHSAFGSMMPHSMAAKQDALTQAQAAVYAAKVFASGQGVALVAIGAVLVLRRPRPPGAAPLAGIIALWTGALVGFYVVLGYFPLSRYLLANLACLPLVAAALWDGGAPGSRPRRGWLVATGLLAATSWAFITFARARPASSCEMCLWYEDVAAYLDEHAALGDRLATYEIGALAYYSDVYLVDLGGLVLNDTLRPLYRRPRRLFWEARPAWSLAPRWQPDEAMQLVLERSARRGSASEPPTVDTLGLYRVDWSRAVPPSKPR